LARQGWQLEEDRLRGEVGLVEIAAAVVGIVGAVELDRLGPKLGPQRAGGLPKRVQLALVGRQQHRPQVLAGTGVDEARTAAVGAQRAGLAVPAPAEGIAPRA